MGILGVGCFEWVDETLYKSHHTCIMMYHNTSSIIRACLRTRFRLSLSQCVTTKNTTQEHARIRKAVSQQFLDQYNESLIRCYYQRMVEVSADHAALVGNWTFPEENPSNGLLEGEELTQAAAAWHGTSGNYADEIAIPFAVRYLQKAVRIFTRDGGETIIKGVGSLSYADEDYLHVMYDGGIHYQALLPVDE
jgi:hypothetical protein